MTTALPILQGACGQGDGGGFNRRMGSEPYCGYGTGNRRSHRNAGRATRRFSWSRAGVGDGGFALLHPYKNKAYLDTGKRVAHYFLADLAMKDDYVPDVISGSQRNQL